MLRLLKWLIYLGVLGFIGLTGYAYLGPFFGADFSPTQTEIRQSISVEDS
ncbi:MAG: hypothetical protein AAF678_08005 [Pseudomonadota bacterium]